LSIHSGDTVILSAHAIPGNEESVYRTINRLFQRGANVVYDPILPVHVSGHASQEEQKLLISLVRPRYFIPVHGEPRHLRQHAHLAEQVGIPREQIAVVENGTPVQFDHAGRMTLGERIPGGYVFVDGGSVGEVTLGMVHERESLARRGVVMVSVAVDRSTGRVIGTPQITARGAFTLRETDALLEEFQATVREVIETTSSNTSIDDDCVKRQTQAQEALARVIREETRRRPIVYVAISEIGLSHNPDCSFPPQTI
jgi:ribonuclease J